MTEIRRMTLEDVDDVYEIEKAEFVVPWTKDSFIKEMTTNSLAVYYVAVVDGKICGYVGMWHVVTEAHIINVCVAKEYQRKGIGRMLVQKMVDESVEREVMGMTLECSTVNEKAINLYKSFGFEIEGTRKEYYEVTKEDCYIMWKYF